MLQVTNREYTFAIIIGILGFIFSSREFLLYLNSQTSITGLLIYYMIIFVLISILSGIGLVIGKTRINHSSQTFGMLLILFAFFIVTNFGESCLSEFYVKGTCNVLPIYTQTEDGAVFAFWMQYFQDIEQLRILTYVITPVILVIIGSAFTSKMIRL